MDVANASTTVADSALLSVASLSLAPGNIYRRHDRMATAAIDAACGARAVGDNASATYAKM